MKLKDLEKRLKQEPNNLGLRVQAAGLMREAGRSLEAVELYRSVALAYRDQGRAQQAIAVCRSILDIAPEDAACQGLLALLQQRSTPSRPSRPPPIAEVMAPAPARSPGPPRAVTPTREPGQPRAVTPTRDPGQPRAVTPTREPGPPRPATATMRKSPMPAAPEVPSLRPATAPAANRPPSPPMRRPLSAPPPRPTTSAPPPRPTTPATTRAITRDRSPDPRDLVASRPSEPPRRSSMDVTPLPHPVPYHMVDPTSQPTKVSSLDLDLPGIDDTRVDEHPRGLAHAARRISGLISESRGIPEEMDLSAELDTRQRRRIESSELSKIAKPPPTVPLDRIDPLDDLMTPPPRDSADPVTSRRSAVGPLPRGSDDALTPPPPRTSHPSLPRIGPPRTSSRPPVVSIPPKTSSRPPVVSIPPKTSSRPPALHKFARDSEDELTQPRDRSDDDDD